MSLHDLSALEQAAAIRVGEVTAVELAEHYLSRADSVPGAYVVLTPDVAIEQARAADAAVAAGEATGDLFGVVCPVKDLNFMVGANTRMGSAVFDLTSYEDDYVVKAMRDAGLVFTGKTTTPEFGLPCYTEPEPEVSPRRGVCGIGGARRVDRLVARRWPSVRDSRPSPTVPTAAARSGSPPRRTASWGSSRVGAGSVMVPSAIPSGIW